MHGLLDSVVLRRADGRGRHASPIGQRTQILLRGKILLAPSASDETDRDS
jgi:hypothetical protein